MQTEKSGCPPFHNEKGQSSYSETTDKDMNGMECVCLSVVSASPARFLSCCIYCTGDQGAEAQKKEKE